MQKYDIIFLGKSSYTEDLFNHFQGHVNTIIIENSCIPLDFSTDFFPEISFIPNHKQVDDNFGYLISKNYRFELSPNTNVLKIFFDECFKHIERINEILAFEASLQINYLHDLIVNNFLVSPYIFFLKKIFKDSKKVLKIFKKLEIKNADFNKFINVLCNFFAPGEINTHIYCKYILFSLLSKKPYKFPFFEQKTKQYLSNGILREIRQSEKGFELVFDNIKIEGKFLISTIPPHILNLANVKHPFTHSFKEIFYNISFFAEIDLPSFLPEYMIYYDENDSWYISIKDKKLNFYKKHVINKIPELDEITNILTTIFPHFDYIPEYTVKPHVFGVNQQKVNKKIKLNKNYYFTKNIEFPYYGSDGEVLFRNIIKETIWKKLL